MCKSICPLGTVICITGSHQCIGITKSFTSLLGCKQRSYKFSPGKACISISSLTTWMLGNSRDILLRCPGGTGWRWGSWRCDITLRHRQREGTQLNVPILHTRGRLSFVRFLTCVCRIIWELSILLSRRREKNGLGKTPKKCQRVKRIKG